MADRAVLLPIPSGALVIAMKVSSPTVDCLRRIADAVPFPKSGGYACWGIGLALAGSRGALGWTGSCTGQYEQWAACVALQVVGGAAEHQPLYWPGAA